MDVILKSKIIDNLDKDLHVHVYGVEICYEFGVFCSWVLVELTNQLSG